MRWRFSVVAYVLVGLSVMVLVAAKQQSAQPDPKPLRVAQNQQAAEKAQPMTDGERASQIERGAYIAHYVAMCVICHTPKDDNGMPIQGREFEGGVIPVQPSYPSMKQWASNAPALGPLVGGAPEDVISLLQTGIWPRTKQSPRPPMPPFRFTEEDARAVVAYLRSVTQ